MTSRSKIIGINRDSTEAIESKGKQPLELDEQPTEELSDSDTIEPDAAIYYDDEPEVRRNWKMGAVAVILAILFASWTGFFAWTQILIFKTAPTNIDIISMLGAWALPVSLIGVVWLLALRSSRAESGRFANTGAKLRLESEALETRMRTVNEEIALAREFLAQNAQDLESIGRQSSEKLTAAALQLGTALADSDEKAKRLEEVSNAAASNLEQLRKHLPVVTSAAKDVSNQIGSAGNSAQGQVDALIAALKNMDDAGRGAGEVISGLEQQALSSSQNITQTITESSKNFAVEIANANSVSDEMAERLKTLAKDSVLTVNKASRKLKARTSDTTQHIEAKLSALGARFESATERAQSDLSNATSKLDTLLSNSSETLSGQLTAVEKALASIQDNVDTQDERFSSMISRISEQIDTSRAQIDALDSGATQKTSNLAFAIETLVQSTQDLDEKVTGSNNGARELVSQAERLNELLTTANREVRNELPGAVSEIEDKITASFAMLDNTRSASREIDENSIKVMDRMQQIDSVIAAQRDAIDRLLASSDEQITSHHEQASALSESLEKTHILVEGLAQQTGGELLTSIERIRDTAEEAVARSKALIEDELGSVAGRLSKQNNALLDNAVESQLSNINDRMQASITAQLSLSQVSTDQLSVQLSEIEEMTQNLEKRIADTQGGFGGIDQEGFARRMALLTESLNSTAIDVAKILSNEVTDTAWGSYLKGDRGIFTRRAVKLLDSGEARAILEHYEGEPEFEEHVNRYIHDFEAMMRVLLSTRDGNAIGVTILSSDVGKLYVALAQAIERLRS